MSKKKICNNVRENIENLRTSHREIKKQIYKIKIVRKRIGINAGKFYGTRFKRAETSHRKLSKNYF